MHAKYKRGKFLKFLLLGKDFFKIKHLMTTNLYLFMQPSRAGSVTSIYQMQETLHFCCTI